MIYKFRRIFVQERRGWSFDSYFWPGGSEGNSITHPECKYLGIIDRCDFLLRFDPVACGKTHFRKYLDFCFFFSIQLTLNFFFFFQHVQLNFPNQTFHFFGFILISTMIQLRPLFFLVGIFHAFMFPSRHRHVLVFFSH